MNATTIAVGSGGTGLTAPGSSGQILVSDGTGFVSQNIDGGYIQLMVDQTIRLKEMKQIQQLPQLQT